MKQKIWICAGIAAVFLACLFADLFILGEPVDGSQLACTADISGSVMELRVSAVESAMALHGWTCRREGADLSIHARKVLVSPLFPSGDYQTVLDLEGIAHVYLGGQLIWTREEST